MGSSLRSGVVPFYTSVLATPISRSGIYSIYQILYLLFHSWSFLLGTVNQSCGIYSIYQILCLLFYSCWFLLGTVNQSCVFSTIYFSILAYSESVRPESQSEGRKIYLLIFFLGVLGNRILHPPRISKNRDKVSSGGLQFQ